MRTPRPCSLPVRPTTLQMLLASGLSRSMVRTHLASGMLRTVRQGVYVSAAGWPDDPAGDHLLRARAECVANPGSVLSHASAALVWGLPSPDLTPWSTAAPSITLPLSGHSSRSGSTVHHTADLPAGHVAQDDDGYGVTSPARTAVDLAADLDLPASLVLLDAAARHLVASFVASARRRDFASPRLAGAARDQLVEVAHARRVTRLDEAIGFAEPARESPAESLSAGHIRLAGLPTPLFQAEIRTPHGSLYPDFLWPEANLIGECDGAVKYDSRRSLLAEKEREQFLRDLGYAIVRWQAIEMMTRPHVVIERIARALGL